MLPSSGCYIEENQNRNWGSPQHAGHHTTYILATKMVKQMPRGSKRGGRVRDKWKDKQWIMVNAPAALGGSVINYVPVSDVNSARGRVIENTMYDILRQDPMQHQTKVFIQIVSIVNGTALTIFKGHEYAKEFLRSLMRRGSSMVSYVDDYKTIDGYVFRVSLVAFSQRRINTEKKHQIRVLCRQFLQERLPKLTLDEFIKEVPLGNLNNDLLEAAKKITPLRHIGIKKTRLISTPTNFVGYEEAAVTSSSPEEAAVTSSSPD
ncbi:MAG TPA: 30S ribosomal protein S3ae [Nitrososphaeraceae archaeon]|nr:30S ribosomal protein S3ae [Nitrososphaeraceae archaeon]